MTDIEYAIEHIDRIKAQFEEDDSKYYNRTNEIKSLKLAISALEKQVPKKPTDICSPVVTWGICPFCKGELQKLGGKANRVFMNNKYCPDCGQKLLWESEEK